MKINEVAKLTGVTVRTLHYYDEIGLFKPSRTSESGYRIYDSGDLEKLQQILFFRELDFPLSEIKEIITSPSFDRIDAMKKHHELLIKKQQHINRLIDLVEKVIEGKDNMSFKEFDTSDIEKTKVKYAQEVKDRWGNTDAYAESERKTKSYGKNDWEEIQRESEDIFKAFAANMDKSPESQEVQQLVLDWQNFITKRFYNCTKEILGCLGLMYTGDERFKKNIDKYGENLAEFMAKAIEFYCK